jgi:hypothetical protein
MSFRLSRATFLGLDSIYLQRLADQYLTFMFKSSFMAICGNAANTQVVYIPSIPQLIDSVRFVHCTS